MPIYHFKCPECLSSKDVFSTLKNQYKVRLCEECQVVLVREAQGPGFKITEILDNGVMARKLERLADAENIYKKRADKDSRDKGFKKNEDDPKEII